MMQWLIWLPLVGTSIFFLSSLIRLGAKAKKLNRQLARTEKYRKAFEATPRSVTLKVSNGKLPDLKSVLTERKAILKARLKKQQDKQRRLLSRLKNSQLNKRK
jgi:hypothetical protein